MQLRAELPQSKRHRLVQEGSALLPSENLRSDIRLNTLRDTETSDSVVHEVDAPHALVSNGREWRGRSSFSDPCVVSDRGARLPEPEDETV